MARSLSKAQLKILQFIADHQGDRLYSFGSFYHWVRAYETGPRVDRRSAERLLQEGYIECVHGEDYHKYYNITEAGRQALAEQEDK